MVNFGGFQSLFNKPSGFLGNLKTTPQADNVNSGSPQAKTTSVPTPTVNDNQQASQSVNFAIFNKVVINQVGFLDPNASQALANDPQAFDADKVVENVLSFVNKALTKFQQSGVDNETLRSKFDQAKSGIAEGIAAARSELEQIGRLSPEINVGIDEAIDKIDQGLEDIKQNFFGGEPVVAGTDLSASFPNIAEGGAVSGSLYREVNYELSRSSQLSIQTQDGDTVNINFADFSRFNQTTSANFSSVNNGNGTETEGNFEQSTTSTSGSFFNFSVEGELDDDEKEAINTLINDIAKVADDFFNLDLDEAFNKALDLGFDSDELSGFQLRLERTEQISFKQVSQYQQLSPITSDEAEKLIRPVDEYINQLFNILEQTEELLKEATEGRQLISETVGQYAKFNGSEDIQADIDRFNQFNDRLLQLLNHGRTTEQPASE